MFRRRRIRCQDIEHGVWGLVLGVQGQRERSVRDLRFETKNIRRKVQGYLISDCEFRIECHHNLGIANLGIQEFKIGNNSEF